MKYRKGSYSKNCCNKLPHQHFKFQNQILKEKKPKPLVFGKWEEKEEIGKKNCLLCLMAFDFSSSLEGKNIPNPQTNLNLALILAHSWEFTSPVAGVNHGEIKEQFHLSDSLNVLVGGSVVRTQIIKGYVFRDVLKIPTQ